MVLVQRVFLVWLVLLVVIVLLVLLVLGCYSEVVPYKGAY